jgi:protoporphyrinogen oxidase
MRSETWIYGSLDEEGLPGAGTIQAAVAADRRSLTGRSDRPVGFYALPAPARLPVYDDTVLEAQAALAGLPAHLAVTGNYLGRLGVSGILESAAEAAGRLAR